MIWFLRIASLAVVITMLCVNAWAFHIMMVWETPRSVVLHPWIIATWFDVSFAFLTFWVWLCWRERSWLASLIWLVAIFGTGNIAISGYIAWVTWRLPSSASMRDVLLRPDAA
jgi:hypothetical protein